MKALLVCSAGAQWKTRSSGRRSLTRALLLAGIPGLCLGGFCLGDFPIVFYYFFLGGGVLFGCFLLSLLKEIYKYVKMCSEENFLSYIGLFNVREFGEILSIKATTNRKSSRYSRFLELLTFLRVSWRVGEPL